MSASTQAMQLALQQQLAQQQQQVGTGIGFPAAFNTSNVATGAGAGSLTEIGNNQIGFSNPSIATAATGGITTPTTPTIPGADGLGDKSLTGLQKGALGLGALNTLTSGVLGIKQYNLGKKQFEAEQANYKENLALSKASMAGNLRTEYNNAVNPDRLAASADDYVKSYGVA